MPNPPTITVVICARNAAGQIAGALRGAMAQFYPARAVKVLVVDNGSTDGTAEIAMEHGAIVRAWKRPGVAGARDFGWRRCRSDLVAFLDADCEPPADWLHRAAQALAARPRLAAVGARLVSPEPTTLAERHIVEARILDTDRCWERTPLQFPFVVTAGMVIRRAALEEVGGFDLTLGRAAGEDADLCWRLVRAGWEIDYLREIEIVHRHRATIPAMLRQVHWYGGGSAALFARWRKELGWRRYTDRSPPRRLLRGLTGALPAFVAENDSYKRWAPTLEALDAAAFLAGKWRGSLKYRVPFF